MGEEVSGYIGRLVPAMQAAYGVAWNIAARGESPTIDDRAWQVQVGYSDFQPRRNGAHGPSVDHDMRRNHQLRWARGPLTIPACRRPILR